MDYPNRIKEKDHYTLARLERLQKDTIAWAKNEKVFDKILTIGREMATEVSQCRFDVYLIGLYRQSDLPIGPIVVAYREYTGRLLSQTVPATWETVQQVIVYLGPEDATLKSVTTRDGAGNPMFYLGLQVLNYECSSRPTGNEKKFIAPGRWLDALLFQYDRALELKKLSLIAAENKERDRLYYEMLLDKEL